MASLSGEKTLAELSAEFGVHPTMISTARSGSCRSSAIFLPGSPPSPECCEAGDDRTGSGAARKPAMRAARDCAQQLLLPPAAGNGRGAEHFKTARPDFHQ